MAKHKMSKSFMITVFLLVLTLTLSSCLGPDPKKPEVTYGEFPFTLIYEINGETITVEDTLVIKYKGVGANEGVGKYNKWDRYLKSEMSGGYMRHNVRLFQGFLENGSSATIFLELGSCEYYMGLQEDRLYYYHTDMKPGDIAILSSEYNGPLSEETLYNDYGIKIIKKELSPPINTK